MRWMLVLTLFAAGCACEPDCLDLPQNPADVRAESLKAEVIAGDSAAKQAAADRLVELGRPGVIAATELTDHADAAVRTTGLQVLRRTADPHPNVVSRIARGLSDPDARVRAEAAATAEAIGEPASTAIPGLVSALGDDAWEVRFHAARALGTTGWQGYEYSDTLGRTGHHDLDRRVREAALDSHEAVRLAWIGHAKKLPKSY